jgi:hypothetical protein
MVSSSVLPRLYFGTVMYIFRCTSVFYSKTNCISRCTYVFYCKIMCISRCTSVNSRTIVCISSTVLLHFTSRLSVFPRLYFCLLHIMSKYIPQLYFSILLWDCVYFPRCTSVSCSLDECISPAVCTVECACLSYFSKWELRNNWPFTSTPYWATTFPNTQRSLIRALKCHVLHSSCK